MSSSSVDAEKVKQYEVVDKSPSGLNGSCAIVTECTSHETRSVSKMSSSSVNDERVKQYEVVDKSNFLCSRTARDEAIRTSEHLQYELQRKALMSRTNVAGRRVRIHCSISRKDYYGIVYCIPAYNSPHFQIDTLDDVKWRIVLECLLVDIIVASFDLIKKIIKNTYAANERIVELNVLNSNICSNGNKRCHRSSLYMHNRKYTGYRSISSTKKKWRR